MYAGAFNRIGKSCRTFADFDVVAAFTQHGSVDTMRGLPALQEVTQGPAEAASEWSQVKRLSRHGTHASVQIADPSLTHGLQRGDDDDSFSDEEQSPPTNESRALRRRR